MEFGSGGIDCRNGSDHMIWRTGDGRAVQQAIHFHSNYCALHTLIGYQSQNHYPLLPCKQPSTQKTNQQQHHHIVVLDSILLSFISTASSVIVHLGTIQSSIFYDFSHNGHSSGQARIIIIIIIICRKVNRILFRGPHNL